MLHHADASAAGNIQATKAGAAFVLYAIVRFYYSVCMRFFCFIGVVEDITMQRVEGLKQRINFDEDIKALYVWFGISNVIIILFILLVAMGFSLLEGKSYLLSIYFAIETMTTVGYGDVVPENTGGYKPNFKFRKTKIRNPSLRRWRTDGFPREVCRAMS